MSASTAYHYRVRAYNTGGASGNSSTIDVTTLSASSPTMTVKLPGESSANAGGATAQTAGTPFNVTVTATTDGTTVNTSYTGTKSITFSGPSGSPSYPSTVSFSSGVGTASLTLVKAETTTIAATDGTITATPSSSLTVNPGAINSYVVTAPSPVQTNTTFAVTVTAKDSSGNIVTTDNSTTVTMTSNSGNIQFDANANGTFGEVGDNQQTLSSGTFTINAIDVATAPETVHITATDGNSKTGTTGSIVINLIPKFKSLASGNWSDYTTWQVSFDGGSSFAPATSGVTPSSTSDTIEIQSGHLVTNTTAVAIDQVTVDVGGTFINNAALTLANGAGTDLDVFGIFNNSSTVSINSSATIVFESGAKYQHNYTASSGTIPTATWSTGSTCEIIGYTSNTSGPNGLGQSFYNFIWNCPNQTGNLSLGGALTTVNNNLTVISTGTKELRFAASTSPTINIGGNWIIQGGTNVPVTGAGTCTINLAGNLLISGGGLNLCSSGSGTNKVNFSGDVSVTGGALYASSGLVTNNFVKAGTQNFTNSGTGTVGGAINWNVSDGSTLNLASGTLGGSGAFYVSGNGTVTGSGVLGTGSSVATINGTLSPGTASTVGTLTFTNAPVLNGTNYLKINRNGGTPLADKIVVSSGTLNYGGTLTVANVGAAIQAGDYFTNFVASSYSGAFTTTNLPALTGVLAWDTSLLSTAGAIDVASSTPASIPLSFVQSAGSFTFTWTDASFDLQSATNVVGPYNTIPGAASGFSTNILTSMPALFFRLHHP